MSRPLSTINQTASQDRVIRPVLLAELRFLEGTLYTHSAVGTINWNGHDWLGVGDMCDVGDIEEGVDVSARGTTLTLSGVPNNLIEIALQAKYRGRLAFLWLAFLTEGLEFADAPVQIFGGRMDTMNIAPTGETCTISVQVESRLIDLKRVRTSRYTMEEQVARHPGDLSLQFIARLADQPLYWGVPNAKTTSGSGTSVTPSMVRVGYFAL